MNNCRSRGVIRSLQCLMVVFGFIAFQAQAGNIITVAGNGTSGYSGDGGTATSATLKLPVEVVVDSSNDVYIADANNYCVRKLNNVSGIITTYAGTCGSSGFSGDGGPATSAKLNGPFRIAVDSADNLYITDNGNHCVRKVDKTTGIITTIAGVCGSSGFSGDNGSATSAKLNSPTGVIVFKP